MGTVKVEFKNAAEDAVFEVPPYGVFKNNTTTTVKNLDHDIVIPLPPKKDEDNEPATSETTEETQQDSPETHTPVTEMTLDELLESQPNHEESGQ